MRISDWSSDVCSSDLDAFRGVLDEARRFLCLPRSEPAHPTREPPSPGGSPEAARRLFRAGRPVAGTQAEAYLRARGLTARLDWPSLRFHPAPWSRADRDAARATLPGVTASSAEVRVGEEGVSNLCTW